MTKVSFNLDIIDWEQRDVLLKHFDENHFRGYKTYGDYTFANGECELNVSLETLMGWGKYFDVTVYDDCIYVDERKC